MRAYAHRLAAQVERLTAEKKMAAEGFVAAEGTDLSADHETSGGGGGRGARARARAQSGVFRFAHPSDLKRSLVRRS